jgi:ADP-heptose:LPS heptosyltransferase
LSESTSETARRILNCCLEDRVWIALDLVRLIEAADGQALFGILAEGLSDRFEPRLVDAYAAIFSQVIAAAMPEYKAAELEARYRRVRRPRKIEGSPQAVYVLSRVTLGADVAVTSILLDAAKRRFPQARVVLAGGRKSYELFAGDPRIEHLEINYRRRGTLRERLEACPQISEPGSIVIDPDSRLTQLGLVPVCPEESYYFFESRSYGAETDEPLGALTRRWAAETLGVPDARAYIQPADAGAEAADVAVSLGVGENPAKGMPDPFEQRLLAGLADRGLRVVVDAGPGGEEEERVRRAIGERSGLVRMFCGAFAAFAGIIARSRLYIGYDSAGQHAAAACGIPLVTVFAGYPSERFRARWHPSGLGKIEVIDAGDRNPVRVLARALEASERLLGAV